MNRPPILVMNFRSCSDLEASYDESADYPMSLVPITGSAICIIAPNGGRIEAHTSEIATAIASTGIALYALEGTHPMGNFAALHLTSHYFVEPRCLDMLAVCDDVVAIHGCKVAGEVVLVGGLDSELAAEFGTAMTEIGLDCHLVEREYLGTLPNNVCNRSRSGGGVPLELGAACRDSPSH